MFTFAYFGSFFAGKSLSLSLSLAVLAVGSPGVGAGCCMIAIRVAACCSLVLGLVPGVGLLSLRT